MAKLVKCKTCGAEIAKTAKVCPKCGAKQHTLALSICAVIIVITAFACVLVLANGFGGENPGAKESKKPGADNGAIEIGETMSSKFFDISIVDAKWTNTLETSLGTVEPKENGKKLLCLIFSAKNTVDETKNLGMFSAYVDKQATLQTTVVGGIDNAMVFVGAVASGMEMKAYVVWEIPEGWKELQLNYYEASGQECQQHFVIHPEDIK